MSSRIGKFAVGVLVAMTGAAAAPLLATSSLQTQIQTQTQQQAQTPEPMLKVDVVLTRQRVDASGKAAAELALAATNLARQEALFEKGLVNKQQLEAARLSVKQQQGPLVSRLPYSLLVSVGGRQTSLRVGVDIPMEPSTTTSKEGVTTTRRDARPIGTSIDSSATAAGDGRYRLFLSIQDSSVVPADRSKEFVSPVIRNFSTSNFLHVREGQALTFSVGTDPISGETLSAEVTVSIVK
jgi:hypothetical protein